MTRTARHGLRRIVRVAGRAVCLILFLGLGVALALLTPPAVMEASTSDLASVIAAGLAVLACVAYAYLVVVVVLTVLARLPGVAGRVAGRAAGAISTETTRLMLRAALGIAVSTPLAAGVGTVAHAAGPPTASMVSVATAGTATSMGAVDATARSGTGDTTGTGDTSNTSEAAHPRSVTRSGERALVSTERVSSVTAEAGPQRSLVSSEPVSAVTPTTPPTVPVPDLPTSPADDAAHRTSPGTGRQQDRAADEPVREHRSGTAPAHPASVQGWRSSPTAVTVRPGDTLWSIAAHELQQHGRRVTAAAIAARWPAWHQHNRAVIGADPHLIRPGQVLQPPPTPPMDAR